MGTNYYAIPKISEKKQEKLHELLAKKRFSDVRDALPEQEIHLGKSSAGWEFCFNHNHWQYYDSLESLQEFTRNHEIRSEYGETITHDEFWRLVEVKKGGLVHETYKERWHEIHPEHSMPDYMMRGDKTEETWFGLRFSTSTEFS